MCHCKEVSDLEQLTNEQIENDLRSYRTIIDSDNIRIKNMIKNKLESNPYIKYALNHVKHDDDYDEDDDDNITSNILPYYAVFDTQTEVDNFLCFETSYDELQRHNGTFKLQQIIFYVLCHSRSVNDSTLGMARHDLISALLKDQFDYTDIFGMKIHCVSDKPGLVDSRYVSRTIVFEAITDNNIVKTVNGIPRLINKQRGHLITDEGIRNKSKQI